MRFTIHDLERARLQRSRRSNGERGQDLVARVLEREGFFCIAPVATSWRIKRAGLRIVGATPKAKVSGDFYCLGQGGIGCLVEVKTRAKGNLTFSAFEDHQRDRLTAWDWHRGLAIVAWVRGQDAILMRWSVLRQTLNEPRSSITWSAAQLISIHVPPTTKEPA